MPATGRNSHLFRSIAAESPKTCWKNELFGHKKGAFTGADTDRKGLFVEASGGTILLDEIGEMPLTLQVKLLRVLQENEIRPVGSSKTRTIDVRVIAATAKQLEKEVKKGTFREDLYYRLNVIRIEMPPLRGWAEDIPLLTHHFIDFFNEKFNKKIIQVSPAAMALLKGHAWPGNVRELENTIERAILLAEENTLMPEHFPFEKVQEEASVEADDVFKGYSLKAAKALLEKRLITKALEETRGNRTRAARLLEISHPSLLTKIKVYHIDL